MYALNDGLMGIILRQVTVKFLFAPATWLGSNKTVVPLETQNKWLTIAGHV